MYGTVCRITVLCIRGNWSHSHIEPKDVSTGTIICDENGLGFRQPLRRGRVNAETKVVLSAKHEQMRCAKEVQVVFVKNK